MVSIAKNIQAIDVKPRGIAVINSKPKDISVLDTKPKGISVMAETVIYTDTHTIKQGQPIANGFFMFLTYPQTINFQVLRP
jgi:hypothetical protein